MSHTSIKTISCAKETIILNTKDSIIQQMLYINVLSTLFNKKAIIRI